MAHSYRIGYDCAEKPRQTFSLVRSSLEYFSAVGDPFRQKDIDKLEKIQRSAARFVTKNYRQTARVRDFAYSEPGLELLENKTNFF